MPKASPLLNTAEFDKQLGLARPDRRQALPVGSVARQRAYGAQRILGLLLGSSMSRVSQVQNVLEGGVHSVAHSDADESNRKERSAVREVSRLTPGRQLHAGP